MYAVSQGSLVHKKGDLQNEKLGMEFMGTVRLGMGLMVIERLGIGLMVI